MNVDFSEVTSPCLQCSETWGGHDFSCKNPKECKYYLTEVLLKNVLQLSKSYPIDLKLEYKKHFDKDLWD